MKTQMKFQKSLCLTMLVLGALTVVLALLYCTGVLNGFGSMLESDVNSGYVVDSSFEAGCQTYLDVQSFNNAILYLGVVLVLAAVVLYITGCNTRRNYYISNYVASIAVAVIFIVISLIILIMNASFLSRVQEVLNDADLMAYYLETSGEFETVYYSENTAMFYVTFVLCIVNILASVVLVLNTVWKNKLMKGEKALLEQGAVKEVA